MLFNGTGITIRIQMIFLQSKVIGSSCQLNSSCPNSENLDPTWSCITMCSLELVLASAKLGSIKGMLFCSCPFSFKHIYFHSPHFNLCLRQGYVFARYLVSGNSSVSRLSEHFVNRCPWNLLNSWVFGHGARDLILEICTWYFCWGMLCFKLL